MEQGRRAGWYPKVLDWMRYFCAVLLYMYGASKLAHFQFNRQAELANRAVGSLTGYQLTWFYFGYSRIYACILGLTQVLGATLMLFRKTTLLGALAMLPVAEEMKKILIVEPAVADQITGEKWNRYIFRTGRNSSQDAISNAVAIGAPGVSIGVLGVDNAFGRDGVAAFKTALAKTGAVLAAEEYAPATTTGTTVVRPVASRASRSLRRTETSTAAIPISRSPIAPPTCDARSKIEISSGGRSTQ